KDSSTMTVDVGLSPARGAGPGVTWWQLSPWSRIAPEKNVPKLKAWVKKAKKTNRVVFKVKKTTASSANAKRDTTEEQRRALLAAILADPGNDDLRAVYADHLSEAGDPRGEFISMQLALAATKRSKKRVDVDELTARSQALLKQHGPAWSKGVAQHTLTQDYE